MDDIAASVSFPGIFLHPLIHLRKSIAIDVREACMPRPTGKGQWTRGLVTQLLNLGERLTLLSDCELPVDWQGSEIQSPVIKGKGFLWHLRAASFLRRSSDIRFYLSTTSYIVPSLLGRAFPCVPVVHDLIAFRREPHDCKATFIECLTLRRTVRHARHVLTVSESTKRDLLERYKWLPPERVTSVFGGPLKQDPTFNESDGRTILCVATLCPRKNQLRLIKAFMSLPPDVRDGYMLILAGARGWGDGKILQLAQKLGPVRWLQYVSDSEYEKLISRCTVFALPSLYEGFGMQILDAMQRGAPVLTSDRGSLKELAGEAACIVDPESIESIAAGLRRLLTDPAYCIQCRVKGSDIASRYSWRRTADLMLNATKFSGKVSISH